MVKRASWRTIRDPTVTINKPDGFSSTVKTLHKNKAKKRPG